MVKFPKTHDFTYKKQAIKMYKMIATPGAKIRENFGKSKRPRAPGGGGGKLDLDQPVANRPAIVL